MAQVDFSNAVLDIRTDRQINNPMTMSDYMMLTYNAGYLYDNNTTIISPGSLSILLNTPTKVSILYTGTFNTSGTEIYIGDGRYNYPENRPWRVSNISFSNGDTYAFVIDIEVSGS